MLLPCYDGKSIYFFKPGGIIVKIKEVIIVEGRDDTAKIHQVVDADTIETNGSAINKKTLDQIKHAKNKSCVITFITKEKARAKHPHNKSLGIEHASPEAIKQALADVYELMEIEDNDINKTDLIAYGLIGGPGASNRRERLGELLQIGHTNGKQL